MLLPDGLKALSFDKLTSIRLCTLLVRYFSHRNIQKCFSQHCPIEDKSSPSCPQHSLEFSFVSGREICAHQKAQPLLVDIYTGIVEQYVLSIFPYCLLSICVSAAVNQVASEQVCSRDSAWSSLGQWAPSWLLGVVQHRPECTCSAPRHSCRLLTGLLHFQVGFVHLYPLFHLPPSSPSYK